MGKRVKVVLALLIALNLMGCEAEMAINDQESQEAKPVVSFSLRKHIYNNGINIELKETHTKDKNQAEISEYYPIISGLKNKKIQDQLNREILETSRQLISQKETEFLKQREECIVKIRQKRSNAYVSYNYNNVIFIDYFADDDVEFKPNYYFPVNKTFSQGYDLNTGEKLHLGDLFKPGFDYKTKLNNYICQYIIENNYDDYATEIMTKPFQGIRDDQNFSFGIDGLRIILDEKNDEFVYNGYPYYIVIPLKYIGEDLYIFDRYFDEAVNIYESEKRIKKLLPNQLEFKSEEIIHEGNEKCSIFIIEGKFINVPNKDIENRLNEITICSFDTEAFKEEAKNYVGKRKEDFYGNYGFSINLFTNAGGYLSMAASEDIYKPQIYLLNRKVFNYDFNLGREIQIRDIFAEGLDIGKTMKDYIGKLKLPLTETMIDQGVEEAIASNLFVFDESGISLYFSPEDCPLDSYQKWIWVPFDAFGMENIKIYQ